MLNFLASTPSRERPPPQQKISGPKSLSLCSFFVPEAARTNQDGRVQIKEAPPPLCNQEMYTELHGKLHGLRGSSSNQIHSRRALPRKIQVRNPEKGRSRGGRCAICRKLRSKIAQNCRYFVLCIRGRVRKSVAHLKVNFGQFYANTPFPIPPSPNF